MPDPRPPPARQRRHLPPAAIDFTGEYSGKDVSTIRVAGKEMRTEEDPNAKLSVKKSGDGARASSIVASNTGDPLCTLKGEQKGDTATMAPGQECPSRKVRLLGQAHARTSKAPGQAAHARHDLRAERRGRGRAPDGHYRLPLRGNALRSALARWVTWRRSQPARGKFESLRVTDAHRADLPAALEDRRSRRAAVSERRRSARRLPRRRPRLGLLPDALRACSRSAPRRSAPATRSRS